MINFISHKQEVLNELDKSLENALWAIGETAEGSAKKYETRVDTGRLRNSISHAVDTTPNGMIVYVGTNVEYAPIHELGGRNISALHFLQRSVSDNTNRYKAILEAALKE